MHQSDPLRIAYIDLDDIRNPLLGAGQAVATYQLGRLLVKKGNYVNVFCSKYPGYQDRIEEGISYVHIGISTPFIRLNNAIFICAVPFAVRKLKNFDVIIECFTSPISTLCSPLFTKIPVIAMPSMFNAREFSRKYKIPFHWVEKFGMKLYSYMLPYSEVDASKARMLQPNITYAIVPQGVTEEYFTIQRVKPKHILFLGRLDMTQKGIDLLLHAYKKALPECPYPLVIAGHGPDEDKIRNLISQLDLKDTVQMVGSTYGDKKFKLISEAVCVAFPSRHDEMCLWTLEALASGMPHVIFDLPESSWIPDAVALKAKPFDGDADAGCLIKIKEPHLNVDMGKNARLCAQSYSWDSVVVKFVAFVKEVLKIEHEKNEK